MGYVLYYNENLRGGIAFNHSLITVSKCGLLLLNRKLTIRLKKWQYVQLLYDSSAQKIRLKKCKYYDKGAIKITQNRKWKSAQINTRAAFKKFGLLPKKSYRVRPQKTGNLLSFSVELKDQ